MTQEDKTLIEKECRAIKDFPVEHAIILNYGTKWEYIGKNDEVETPTENIEDCVFIHNHPMGDFKIQPEGLSIQDVYLAMQYKMKCIVSIQQETGIIYALFPHGKQDMDLNNLRKSHVVMKNAYRDFVAGALEYRKANNKIKSIPKKALIKLAMDKNMELHIWKMEA